MSNRYQPIRLSDRDFDAPWGVVDTQADLWPASRPIHGVEKEKTFELVQDGLDMDTAKLLADAMNRREDQRESGDGEPRGR